MGRPIGQGKVGEVAEPSATKKAPKRASERPKTGSAILKRRRVAVSVKTNGVKVQGKRIATSLLAKKSIALSITKKKINSKASRNTARTLQAEKKKVTTKKVVSKIPTPTESRQATGAGSSKQVARSVRRTPLGTLSAAATGPTTSSHQPKFVSYKVIVPRKTLLRAMIVPIQIRIEPCPELEQKLREARPTVTPSSSSGAKTGLKSNKSGEKKAVSKKKAVRPAAAISNGTKGNGGTRIPNGTRGNGGATVTRATRGKGGASVPNDTAAGTERAIVSNGTEGKGGPSVSNGTGGKGGPSVSNGSEGKGGPSVSNGTEGKGGASVSNGTATKGKGRGKVFKK